jgi:hypothetical protein
MSDTRIVLVNPGDVLILGNVAIPVDKEAREAFDTVFHTLKETVGLAHVLVFEDGVDLMVNPMPSEEPCHGTDWSAGCLTCTKCGESIYGWDR